MIDTIITIVSIALALFMFMRLYPLFAYRYIAKARNVVYNQVLRSQHKYEGKRLKRLFERNPQWAVGGWELRRELNKGHGSLMERDGFIAYNTYSKLEFYWWFLTVWMWCDDDANAGNTDCGYISSLLGYTWETRPDLPRHLTERSKDRSKHYLFRWFRKPLERAHSWLLEIEWGNAFDLGDRRADTGVYSLSAIYAWVSRNPIYNLKYWWNV